ncbi:putative vomeronasal receptor-like protein 4 [Sciurus carolinensis]|uniref:putative vomeronasal receptor-like protein 4 n=1 Tax=Sciurus carolinensis TaxID=30640 RepID=UPI001FB3EF7F|nr:putative vomeronasal receptor-like protein 4 [Sciurus carolinensis]
MKQNFNYVAIRNAFYPQAGIGISANTFLFCLHIAAVFGGPKPRLTDLLITHLALIHILMLLTMELLVSTDVWEAQDIPHNFKCKVLIFLNRVMRGLSICTTCVLSVFQAVTLSPNLLFLGLLVLSSAYMIFLLHRHKQRTMSLHSSRFSLISSPEQRATHTILLLISYFEILYCVDFIISLFISVTCTNDPILVSLQMLVANGYGTISPLVLISADTQIIKVMQTKWRNKFQLLIKLM